MDFSPVKRCRGRVSLPHTTLGPSKSSAPAGTKVLMDNMARITNTSGLPARDMFSYGRSSFVGVGVGVKGQGEGQGRLAIHKAVKAGDLASVLALHSHTRPGLVLGQRKDGGGNTYMEATYRRIQMDLHQHSQLRSSTRHLDAYQINKKNVMSSVKKYGLEEIDDGKHSKVQRLQQVRNISFAYSMQQLEIASVNCESSQLNGNFYGHHQQEIVLNNYREQTDLQDVFGDRTLQDVFTHDNEDDKCSTYFKQKIFNH